MGHILLAVVGVVGLVWCLWCPWSAVVRRLVAVVSPSVPPICTSRKRTRHPHAEATVPAPRGALSGAL